MKSLIALIACLTCLPALSQNELKFLVTFTERVQEAPARGRLTVYLIKEGDGLDRADPANAPFFSKPQPMFSIDATGLKPGEVAELNDENCVFFPVLPGELPEGRYRAQAVLDQMSEASSWSYEAGNLFSSSRDGGFEITERGVVAPVHLTLDSKTTETEHRESEGLSFIKVKSELLSEFRGRDVYFRAGVVEPIDMEPGKKYPVVYQVPGFGGTESGAYRVYDRHQKADPDSELGRLARSAYWVVLNPEGPNGHHLFANSANNGPVGAALIEELIPTIDTSFSTIQKSSARLLRGHSSGGWSTLWLGITYPDTFGGVWSTAPDPVDFSSFQAVDIYNDANMYRYEDTGQVVWNTSYSDAEGNKGMTILDENRMEEVIGPGNTSGQQWDSWLAVFGPASRTGAPAALYDAMTGEIDSRVVEHFARYDISKKLAADRTNLGPLMKERVRLVVGDMDNYDLDEAVVKLKSQLDALTFAEPSGGFAGYIEIVPGADHGSVFRSPIVRDFPRQMLQMLEENGHVGPVEQSGDE